MEPQSDHIIYDMDLYHYDNWSNPAHNNKIL